MRSSRLLDCFPLVWKSLHGWLSLFPGSLLELHAFVSRENSLLGTLSTGLRCLLSGGTAAGAAAGDGGGVSMMLMVTRRKK